MSSTQYDSYVIAAAQQNGIDPSTAIGIFRNENGPGSAQPPQVAGSSATGLMQITSGTAQGVMPGVTYAQLQDPKINASCAGLVMANLVNHPAGASITSADDLTAAYYVGGVYKDGNGNYTDRHGNLVPPGNTMSVNAYVAKAKNTRNGTNTPVSGSGSGRASSVSPHRIPDQAGKYQGIQGLYLPITNFNIPNPFNAYVSLVIGGAATTDADNSSGTYTFSVSNAVTISPDLTPTRRQIRVTDFNFEEGMAAGSGHFTVKFFLETADQINRMAALVNEYKKLNIVWGYQQAQNDLNRSFTGTVLRFYHQFQSSGYMVIIEGMDAAFSGLADASAYSYAPDTGKVSDIVSYIAAQHPGWGTVIEETIPLPSGDDPKAGQRVFLRVSGQTELAFINEQLCPVAQSKIRNYNGIPFGHYRAFFSEGALHFHSILVDTSKDDIAPVRTYVWGGLGAQPRTSVVLDFVMDYTGFAFQQAGIGKLNVVSTDGVSGQVNQTAAVGQRTADGPLQAIHPVGAQDSNRTSTTTAKSKAELQAKTIQKYLEVKDACFTATLTILGDPFLRCADIIHVTVQQPGKQVQQFYDWIVMHMSHNIAGGQYTTTCQLIRSDMSSLVEAGFQVDATSTTQSDFANLGAQTNTQAGVV